MQLPVRTRRISATIATAALCLSAVGAVLPPAAVGQATAPVAVEFATPGRSEWTVPAGICSISVIVAGAGGGTRSRATLTQPSSGAVVGAALDVVPGERLAVAVGGRGGDSHASGPGAGGVNGGAPGGWGYNGPGSGGGGASDVRRGDDLSGRIVVAGGGGGHSGRCRALWSRGRRRSRWRARRTRNPVGGPGRRWWRTGCGRRAGRQRRTAGRRLAHGPAWNTRSRWRRKWRTGPESAALRGERVRRRRRWRRAVRWRGWRRLLAPRRRRQRGRWWRRFQPRPRRRHGDRWCERGRRARDDHVRPGRPTPRLWARPARPSRPGSGRSASHPRLHRLNRPGSAARPAVP